MAGSGNTFDNEFEELLRWPYAVHAIDESLDVKLIEGRGKQLLFQALNQRNVVGFAGSGLSQAYGRLSWRDWKTAQVDTVLSLADAFTVWAGAADKFLEKVKETTTDQEVRNFVGIKINEINYPNSQTKRLSAYLRKLVSDGPALGGDMLPITFQVAEQLYDLLLNIRKTFLDQRAGERASIDFKMSDRRTKEVTTQALLGIDAQNPLVEELEKTLVGNELDDSNDLSNLLDEIRHAAERFVRICNSPYAVASSFADLAKMLLVDECAHATQILQRSFKLGADTGHADVALPEKTEELASGITSVKESNLGRDIPGIRQDQHRYNILKWFKTGTIQSIAENLAKDLGNSPWGEICKDIERYCKENAIDAAEHTFGRRMEVDRRFVAPPHRFVLEVLLAIADDPTEIAKIKTEKIAHDHKVERRDFESRLSVTDEEIDPIDKLGRQLRVRNFVTTNYDFELERYFLDKGYRNWTGAIPDRESRPSLKGEWPLPDHQRTDGLGGMLRDSSFSPERATDLITFAVDQENADASVFHLHGGAEAASRIVVTERDYMDLYLRGDEYRGVIDDGIRIAFSSNPILFVGLGMDEADILRPLRQFMSDQNRLSHRKAVALFPGDRDPDRRVKEASSLYLRYGVHTIAYGDGYVRAGDDFIPVDWLHGMLTLIGDLRAINNEMLTPLQFILLNASPEADDLKAANGMKSAIDDLVSDAVWSSPQHNPFFDTTEAAAIKRRLARLRKKLCKLSDKDWGKERLGVVVPDAHERCPIPETKKTYVPALCYFRTLPPDHARGPIPYGDDPDSKWGKRRPDHHERSFKEEEPAGRDLYLKFERYLVGSILKMTLKNYFDAGQTTTLREHLARTSAPDEAQLKLYRDLARDLRARIAALDGVVPAILTGAISATLDRLEFEQKRWWEHWQISPPVRGPKFQVEPSVSPEPANGVVLPVRYVRHMIDDVISRTDLLRKAGLRKHKKETDFGEIEGGTGFRSFDTFLAALTARTAEQLDARQLSVGRRVHLVAGERGTGKGSFLTAFITPAGLGNYITASWPETPFADNGELTSPPDYVAAMFVNFSFSSEISSAIDMVIDTLTTTVAALKARVQGANPDEYREWHIDTLDMLALVSQMPAIEKRDRKIDEKVRKFIENLSIKDNEKLVLLAAGKDPRQYLLEFLSHRYEVEESIQNLARNERLRRLFDSLLTLSHKIQHFSDGAPLRVLLVLSATDLLFYEGGVPKNRDIEQLLVMLTGDGMANCPFDLVMIGGETKVGLPITRETEFSRRYLDAASSLEGADGSNCGRPAYFGKPTLRFVVATQTNIKPDSAQNIVQRMRRSAMPFAEDLQPKPAGETTGFLSSGLRRGPDAAAAAALPKSSNFECTVHFARMLRPEQLLVRNYRALAVTLFVGQLLREVGPLNRDDRTKLVEAWDTMSAHLGNTFKSAASKPDRAVGNRLSRIPSTFLGHAAQLLSNCARIIAHSIPASSPVPYDRTAGIGSSEITLKDQLKIISTREFLTYIKVNKYIQPGGKRNLEHIKRLFGRTIRSVLLNRYEWDDAAKKEWEQIRAILRGNRFCLTIILAAAQQAALSGRDPADGAERAEAFIRKTIDRVNSVGIYQRGDEVVDAVLDLYDSFNRIGEPRHDTELHDLILRHLAVIGAPVSADVLVRVPMIRRYFDRNYPPARRRTQHLVAALTELTLRGLVFRLNPAAVAVARYDDLASDGARREETFADRPAKSEYRYALHRLMQRNIIKKMGAGPREFVEINSFAPSLYASMPADLPRLTPDAYGFLRQLLTCLSQYPDSPSHEQGIQGWYFGDAPIATQVQGLRAALALTRSTFSVAVVSRFDGYAPDRSDLVASRQGYFESYRIQTRWLIRKAWHLLGENQDEIDTRHFAPEPDQTAFSAFYKDEIVWLYNECGVTSLVQGNLEEAVALFRQAILLNRGTEGQLDGGMQHNRISLNLAIAQIERGRFDPARRRLQAICESEDHPSFYRGRLWHIAHGYLGLIHQIGGDSAAATSNYRRAIAILRVYDDSRACAVFCRHLSDLERAAGHFEEARRECENAIDFAENGGHEDMRQKALLTRIRLDIQEAGIKGKFPSPDILTRLARVEAYARTMEMPSLLCETLFVRAALLKDQGETTLAGNILADSIAIAKRNGMRLRLNASLTAYARVLGSRGLKGQARRLLSTCQDMAKRHRNQLELRRIEAALAELAQ